VTISSAHPDRLRAYGHELASALASALDLARAAEAALARYTASCPDAVEATGGSPLTARLALDALRSHAAAVAVIGDAFARADHGGGDLAVRLDDLELTRTLVEHHSGVAAGALLAPLHGLEEAGAAAGRELAAAVAEGDLHGAGRLLLAVTTDSPPDEVFAAALVNELGPESLVDLTEGIALLAPDPWQDPSLGLAALVSLTTAATRTWDGPPRGTVSLDRALVLALTETAAGRSALRALAGVPGQRPGRRFLALVVEPLLVRSGAATDTGSALASFLEREGRSPDRVLLDLVATDRDLALHLVTADGDDAVATIHARVGEPDDRRALTAVVAAALAHPDLTTVDGARARRGLVIDVIEAIGSDPRGADPGLVRLAAGTVLTDADAWAAVSSTRTDGDVSATFEAVALDEDALVTAIAGFELYERRILGDLADGARPGTRGAATDRPAPTHLPTDLVHLDELLADLHRGAAAADVPDDDWAGLAAGGHWLADRAEELAGIDRRARLASGAVEPLVRLAIDRAHAASRGRPGTSTDRLHDHRARRRRNAWAALAHHPRHRDHLVWDVVGSPIRSVEDLLVLGDDVEAGAELTAWARAQPADLAAWAEQQVLTLERTGR
jgi:hypothetical protein